MDDVVLLIWDKVLLSHIDDSVPSVRFQGRTVFAHSYLGYTALKASVYHRGLAIKYWIPAIKFFLIKEALNQLKLSINPDIFTL